MTIKKKKKDITANTKPLEVKSPSASMGQIGPSIPSASAPKSNIQAVANLKSLKKKKDEADIAGRQAQTEKVNAVDSDGSEFNVDMKDGKWEDVSEARKRYKERLLRGK